jgi:hypothetical protein
MLKMLVNKEKMRLFIEALRSGEYLQGFGTLAGKTDGGDWKYCCLGVACEAAIRDGVVMVVESKATTYGNGANRHRRVYEGTSTVLPVPVRRWLGISGDDSDPRLLVGETGVKNHATNLNDNAKWSFEQIADAFEKTFLAKENNEDSSIPA